MKVILENCLIQNCLPARARCVWSKSELTRPHLVRGYAWTNLLALQLECNPMLHVRYDCCVTVSLSAALAVPYNVHERYTHCIASNTGRVAAGPYVQSHMSAVTTHQALIKSLKSGCMHCNSRYKLAIEHGCRRSRFINSTLHCGMSAGQQPEGCLHASDQLCGEQTQ